jgi:hypothetical protein
VWSRGMFRTVLHRGHWTARIPAGAFGNPGLRINTIMMPRTARSAPSAKDLGTSRFLCCAIAAQMTAQKMGGNDDLPAHGRIVDPAVAV